MSDKIIFKLTKSFTFGSEEITELTLLEPTAKDLYNLGKDQDFKSMFEFACNCANEPVKKLEKMNAKDALRFVQVASDFLADGQAIGPI